MSQGVLPPASPATQPTPSRPRPARTALAGVRPALAGAWAVAAVRRGLLGVVLITVGSLTPGYLPEANPVHAVPGVSLLQTGLGATLGTAVLLLGVGLLIDAWVALRPSRAVGLSLPAVLAIWSVPFLLAPPVFSADAYAYAAEGWLMHHGLNPYDVGVGSLPGPFADQTVMVWRWTPAPYGPLDLVLNHAVVDLFGGHAYWAVVGMRLPVVVAVAIMAVLLPRLADRTGVDRQLVLWLALVNPLTFVHLVGGAHNDALMMALVVIGLWLALQGRLLLAVLAVAAAAAIKVPAILAVLAVAVLADPVLTRANALSLERYRPGRGLVDTRARVLRTIRRGVVASVLVIAAFLLINLATGLGFGWIPGMNVPGMVKTMSPSTMLGELFSQLFYALGLYDLSWTSVRVVRTLFMVGAVVLIGWLALTVAHRRPLTSLAWSFLAVALCGPVLHGWYLSWGGVLLGLSRPSRVMVRAAVWVSSGLLVYIAVNLAWKNDATVLGAVAAGLIAWRLWELDRTFAAEFPGEPGWRLLVPRPSDVVRLDPLGVTSVRRSSLSR
ncbi:hypothetical protein DT076_09620 [Desertihabitans brevis]|uniref:DUF2029 domain-containing protein n=1 Tax=Desertihabitans brevis TaxID=2268447 RepID=A0A367YUY2_9ACTN|nr:polyprenol phosphomannose-dependent alpha 1,6 mannosyltransferase MptB [Desertihabitans brevis]RCK69696.1 hypothetical protein DT076_09620 [Desertihabitans brevis]